MQEPLRTLTSAARRMPLFCKGLMAAFDPISVISTDLTDCHKRTSLMIPRQSGTVTSNHPNLRIERLAAKTRFHGNHRTEFRNSV